MDIRTTPFHGVDARFESGIRHSVRQLTELIRYKSLTIRERGLKLSPVYEMSDVSPLEGRLHSIR